MPDSEKELLLRRLHEGREALGGALAGLDETLARHKPPAGGWSVLECMEHMVQSERYLLTRLHVAKLSPEPFEKSRRAAKIAALALDRTRPIQAPSGVHPQGRFSALQEALAAFDVTRAEVVRYVEQSGNDLQCWITDHPLIPGPVTCYETLLMMAAHPARHAQQIIEIRAALAHPEPTSERLP
jgi:hypothetical protein